MIERRTWLPPDGLQEYPQRSAKSRPVYFRKREHLGSETIRTADTADHHRQAKRRSLKVGDPKPRSDHGAARESQPYVEALGERLGRDLVTEWGYGDVGEPASTAA
jgi:hypothetical protein